MCGSLFDRNLELHIIGPIIDQHHYKGIRIVATEELLETRLISGTGIIRIPTYNYAKRVFTLYGQVVRPPRSPYLNLKSNPPEGFFARITCVKNDTVFKVFDQTFDQQAWTFNPDVTAQTLIAVKCMYEGILQTFVNLGNARLWAPFIVDNTIEDYRHLAIEFSEFRIVCYATTAIAFTLKAINLDFCNTEYQEPLPPSEPPIPPSKVSSDTPLEITPPYSNDDVTKKADIDESFTPPTVGEVCVQYNIAYSYTQENGVVATNGGRVFGPLGRIRRYSTPSENGVELECRGQGGGSRSCQEFGFVKLVSGPPPNDYINPSLVGYGPA